jgi:isopentenyl-diphosphate delta-isomerase
MAARLSYPAKLISVKESSPAARTAARKAEHLKINLEQNVDSGVRAGFDRYRLLPLALPEVDLADVSLRSIFLGRALQAPLLISCMTGGVEEAGDLNRLLAEVAETEGLALGLGSGRVLLEAPEVLPTFAVRNLAPSVPLLANLGATHLLKGTGVDDCRRLLEMLEADALVLHLNALQEALQPDGTPRFAGLLDKIEEVCRRLGRPVLVKEVGWGIPPDDVVRLGRAGVFAVDVAGAGGTSWSQVERHRLPAAKARVAAAFREWGLPTAEAVRRARAAAPELPLIASGGVKDGMDVTIAIALGADLVGIAGPFLRAAAKGAAAATALAKDIKEVLRIAMFCVGAPSLTQLKGTDRLEHRDGAPEDARA